MHDGKKSTVRATTLLDEVHSMNTLKDGLGTVRAKDQDLLILLLRMVMDLRQVMATRTVKLGMAMRLLV